MKKILYLDYDDTCVDTSAVVLNFVFQKFGRRLTTEDITHWTFLKDTFGNEGENLWEIPGMYSNITPIDGIYQFLIEAEKHYECKILTHSSPSMIAEKDRHIAKYFGLQAIHSTEKWRHTGNNPIVDDGVHNIDGHITNNQSLGILFNHENKYGWARHILKSPHFRIANTYKELADILF